MENLGFLLALAAAFCWGTYMVPFKKSQSHNLAQFQVLMGVGVGISGLIISLISGYSLNLNIYALVSGLFWGVANAISLVAVLNLGISRAIPVMSSLVILSSFLWGALVFHEFPSGVALGFVGIGLIMLGVIIVSTTDVGSSPNGNMQSQNIKKGLIMAVLAGLIFGSQLTPLKVGNVTTRDFFFSVCSGIFFTSLIISQIMKVKFKKEAVGMSLLSGIIWNIGNLLSLVSLERIGLSKMGPISQLSILVVVLWGLFYFKEIDKLKTKLQVLIGAIILVFGILVLGFA